LTLCFSQNQFFPPDLPRGGGNLSSSALEDTSNTRDSCPHSSLMPTGSGSSAHLCTCTLQLAESTV